MKVQSFELPTEHGKNVTFDIVNPRDILGVGINSSGNPCVWIETETNYPAILDGAIGTYVFAVYHTGVAAPDAQGYEGTIAMPDGGALHVYKIYHKLDHGKFKPADINNRY